MSEEQQKTLLERLEPTFKNSLCSVCFKRSWTISDRLWEVREFNGGGLSVGGSITPLVSVMCTNCGNTLLLNALHLKLVDSDATGENANGQ